MIQASQVAKLESSANTRDIRDSSSIPGSGRSLGGGNTGNPLQYSCLGSPMDRGAWRAPVHAVTEESDVTERAHRLFKVTLHLKIPHHILFLDRTTTEQTACELFLKLSFLRNSK